LIFGEATAGLDEENERTVTDALMRLSAGRTPFWITHDLTLAARASLILLLEGGRILERGSHGELMRLGRRYASLYTLGTAAFETHPRQPSQPVPT
jgi:ATP-binding cassette subfamily B protein